MYEYLTGKKMSDLCCNEYVYTVHYSRHFFSDKIFFSTVHDFCYGEMGRHVGDGFIDFFSLLYCTYLRYGLLFRMLTVKNDRGGRGVLQ